VKGQRVALTFGHRVASRVIFCYWWLAKAWRYYAVKSTYLKNAWSNIWSLRRPHGCSGPSSSCI